MSRKNLYINRAKVDKLRRAAGYSSGAALANKLGVTPGYLNSLMKIGEVGCMNAATLMDMASLLKIDVNDLVTSDPPGESAEAVPCDAIPPVVEVTNDADNSAAVPAS